MSGVNPIHSGKCKSGISFPGLFLSMNDEKNMGVYSLSTKFLAVFYHNHEFLQNAAFGKHLCVTTGVTFLEVLL